MTNLSTYKHHRVVAFSAIALLSGCAMRPQVVRLNPTVAELASTPAGTQGDAVALQVKDERLSQVIGQRGEGRGAPALSTSADSMEVLRDKVASILSAQGFTPVSRSDSEARSLTVRLEKLTYSTVVSSQKPTVQIETILVADAANGKRQVKKTYHATREQQIVMTPVATTNEEWINQAVSEALNSLATDASLFEFLRNTP